jgi:hypothetical protein
MVDRGQPDSRRSKPSSRTPLIGEQPNPWDLLQPQDGVSRHRGAKQFRRYRLLRIISLLSPAYLLSVKQKDLSIQNLWVIKADFHPCLICISHSPAGLCLYTLKRNFSIWARQNYNWCHAPPLTFRRGPPQPNYHSFYVLKMFIFLVISI